MTSVELDKEGAVVHGVPQVVVRITSGDTAEETVDHPSNNRGAARWWIVSGIFLFVLGSYVLTNPGRIDIIDGQIRFDVAYNWMTQGRPIVRDRGVAPILGVTGKGGATYSYYGAPASVLSMPLVWLGLHFNEHNIQLCQYLFSLTSPIIGAMIAPILFLFYLEMGISLRKAFMWTMVSGFATMVWPISCTTFDNAQHAFFGLAAAYLGFLSIRRNSKKLALMGGVMAGILFLYQEYFLLMVPALAVSTLEWSSIGKLFSNSSGRETDPSSATLTSRIRNELRIPFALVRTAFRGPGEARSSFLRYVWFLVGFGVGVVVSFAYNDLRFGSLFDNGKMRSFAHRHPVWGNPIAGLPTLLISPGKSLILYSPPLVLSILGIRYLWRRRPEVALVILGASLPLILFMSCYAGLGGDFCWGPRYLTALLPLWAVAFPFVPVDKIRREAVLAIVGLGLLVQIMAVSVEPQRFFFERGLSDLFWAEDRWTYFKHSALLARPAEMLSLSEGPPATAVFLTTAPLSDWYTYAIMGTPWNVPRSMAPVWMRNFKIFYLPRPFPLAMSWIPPVQRPINLAAWLWGVLSVTFLGLALIYRGFKISTMRETTRAWRGLRSLIVNR